MVRIAELEFDENNEEKLAAHGIAAVDVLELLENPFTLRRNKNNRAGARQLIGRTHGGRDVDDHSGADTRARPLATGDWLGQHAGRKETSDMTDEPTNYTGDEEWETETAEVDRPVSVVVSVRLPSELGHRLAREASARGVGVSAIVREAVAEYVDSAGSVRTSYDWSVSSPDVSVTFFAGRGIQGRTAGQAKRLDEALLSET
jgi:hypothetical protein